MSTSSTGSPTPPSGGSDRFRLSLRNSVLLILAASIAVITGFLLTSGGAAIGQAVIGGATAFGTTLFFLDRIID